MKNPCLEAALKELDAAGVRDIEQAYGGKHLQLRWKANGHGQRVYTMPATPSDIRAAKNTRAGIRRMLREDGLLAAPEPKPVVRRPSLEQRVAALEREMKELKTEMQMRKEMGGYILDSAGHGARWECPVTGL